MGKEIKIYYSEVELPKVGDHISLFDLGSKKISKPMIHYLADQLIRRGFPANPVNHEEIQQILFEYLNPSIISGNLDIIDTSKPFEIHPPKIVHPGVARRFR